MEVDGDSWFEDEPVIYIPFTPAGDQDVPSTSYLPNLSVGDVSGGSEERYELFEAAWSKCEDEIISAARQLCAPTMDSVIKFIKSQGEGEDERKKWVQKLMPSRELPTALVVGDDRQELFDELMSKVSQNTDLVASLLPEHFSNLQVALKVMIEGFIRSDDDKKRRATMSLATYDMQLLCSWYSWKSRETQGFKLVVFVQDFEACNAAIAHDLFRICSNYIDRLPLTFILGASSSDVMSTMFSRASRSLVSVKKLYMPDGHQRFEALMRKTFFNVESFPHLVLSGGTLSWLHHSWLAYHGSLDALLSHLQLIYLRHFQHPLTLLWNGKSMSLDKTLSKDKKTNGDSIQGFTEEVEKSLQLKSPNNGKQKLSSLVDTATDAFRRSVQDAKFAFLILLEIQQALRTFSTQPTSELNKSGIHLMELFGDGKLDDICAKLLRRVRLLTKEQLLTTIERLLEVSDQIGETELVGESFMRQLNELRSKVADSDQSEEEARIKHPVSDGLATTLESELWPVMTSWISMPLSEVWRTTDSSPPLDILNPSFRSTLLSSLSQPGGYLLHDLSRYVNLRSKGKGKAGKYAREDKSANGTNVVDPDICILFSRYINAGKTINVYDWFESFAQGIENTRPTRRGKLSSQAAQTDEENWRRESYGRFMWSLHELDMLGFLRWTGRGTGKKGAECAGKSIWVTPDGE